jgi:hypothetical protein
MNKEYRMWIKLGQSGCTAMVLVAWSMMCSVLCDTLKSHFESEN